MPGKGKLIGGVLLIVIAIGSLIFGGIAATTYMENIDTLDEKKAVRDEVGDIGGNTSAMDDEIESDEQVVKTQMTSMSMCSIIGVILMIVGIVLIIKYRKQKSEEPPGVQPGNAQQPQYPPPPTQYPQQQPPQYPPQQPPQYPQQQPPQYPPQQPPQYPQQQPPQYPPQQPPQYPQY